MLLQKSSNKEMEMNIIEYVMYLRNASFAFNHKSSCRLEINDFVGMNWKKISKYVDEFFTFAEDRPYIREENRTSS
jgi:hypothetical protein